MNKKFGLISILAFVGIAACTQSHMVKEQGENFRSVSAAETCMVAIKAKGKTALTSAHFEACLKAASPLEKQPKITSLEHLTGGPGAYFGKGESFSINQDVKCYHTPHYKCWDQPSSQSQKVRCITADQNWGAFDEDIKPVGTANAIGPCLDDKGNAKTDPTRKGDKIGNKKIECLYEGTKPILSADAEGIEGDQIKVKYMKDLGEKRQREVMTEVAANRILWALGFVADRNYSVKSVECKGCKSDPWNSNQCTSDANSTANFNLAAIERKYEGKDLEVNGVDSWSWSKAKQLYQTVWNEKQKVGYEAYVTTLRLFNIFNWVDKQNRTMCAKYGEPWDPTSKARGYPKKKDPTVLENGLGPCSRPVFYMQDVGSSFGKDNSFGANSRGEFKDYDGMKPIINNQCDLGTESGVGFGKLSKEAMNLLLGRIKYLEDTFGKTEDGKAYKWAYEIFKSARYDIMDSNGTLQKWYDSFYRHIDELKAAAPSCQSRYPNFTE